jgi:hypothetical protein
LIYFNCGTTCAEKMKNPWLAIPLAEYEGHMAIPEIGQARSSSRSTLLHLLTSAAGRFCCKSLFALVIKNFPGFRRDFRVKMWGTSSPDDKLTDDLGNAIEGTRISGCRLDFFLQQEN